MTLMRGGRVHTAADPAATALAVSDGMISWVGGEHAVATAGRPDRVVDLDGLLVVPGFVDAHVHSTDAGLALTGLDLSAATSAGDCLARIAAFAASHPQGVLWGHGWDETGWDRPDLPSRADLDQLLGRRPAYLSRVDVHSALVTSALGVSGDLPGYDPHGPLRREAHAAARTTARSLLTTAQRTAAQRSFLAAVAAQGIVEVHECAGSDPAGRDDLAALLGVDAGVSVLGYLAAAVSDPEQARKLVDETGAYGLAGDLSVDGALGSHTAALRDPYEDEKTTRGVRYLTDDEIADHLWACAVAGVQPGFHAIGEDAVSAVAAGLRRAAERLGTAERPGTVALAAVTPRIEHAEMPDTQAIASFAATGTIASVQPLFDALWGGDAGMYVTRVGPDRASRMNPFAALAAAGVPLALGSDAPVTPARPWDAVRAAALHRTDGSGLSARAAFVAHTRGGHRAAGRIDRGVGTISVGAPAHLAIVRAGALVRPPVDPAVARWSTDPRSRVPLLPDLHDELPTCVATMVAGRVVYDTGLFEQTGTTPIRL